MSADDAVNYGVIGALIGHEISHGFDDQSDKMYLPPEQHVTIW